ncbi:alpha-N-acetylgalactosaminide alpha-2,6-sialyltransferase 1 [Rhineura floridana]|uniref:alpha-N-acetylgalactosaminide alpha-2,6-sialyltransferase 1 n=1 Tax=Rhineura floridana TaxID=261503 RepID=UPI002AC84815|nr:alpha-N-acetylgalactosaminide alpha-2,6-sialyltransferase 1 [Rhineura floridana]
MRPIRRRFPKGSRLLLIGFLFLILSFAAYIGFTEKHAYSQFSYFIRATNMPQIDIQHTAPEPMTSRPPNVKRGPGSSPLEQDAVKRLAANGSNLYTQEKNAAVTDPSKSTMTAAASKNHAEALNETPAVNKEQGEKKVTPTSESNPEEEKNKHMVSEHKGKTQAEVKYMTPTSNQKQAKEKVATRASSQQLPEGRSVTPPSSANQTERKQSREMGIAKESSTRVASLSVVMVHNVSVPATHLIPTAAPKKRLKAADFRSEPHWDFDDQYLLDNSTSKSSCPDSLRVKAAKSDWLKDRFLPNITLFMDRSHFSGREWERLEHFAPPYGFMELNYSLVKEVITMLPSKPYHQVLLAQNSSWPSRCISCAVVGNGGILNNSRMGQEIDSHDYVFRVNGAVTKGYEKDVGTRTSFYGFTAYSLVSSVMLLGKNGFKKIPMGKEIKYLHFLEGERDYEWLKALLLNKKVRKGFLDVYGPNPRDKFDNNFILDKYFVIHPDFLRYMKNRFLKSKTLDKSYWRLYRPTTGAFLLLTALHLCDQVSAYGYITEGYQKYSDHYYDKKWKRLIFYANHDFDLERRTWKKLHDSNIMKLYQRS